MKIYDLTGKFMLIKDYKYQTRESKVLEELITYTAKKGSVYDSSNGLVMGVRFDRVLKFNDTSFFKPLTVLDELLMRISMELMGIKFSLILDKDKKYGNRDYLRVVYKTKCSKNNTKTEEFKGRKWYLSEYMTPDEVVKTAYSAFEMAVKHEILEGFKVDNKPLFNPHVNFEALLAVCTDEVTRQSLEE